MTLTRRYPNNGPDGKLAQQLTPYDVSSLSPADCASLIGEVKPHLRSIHQDDDGHLRDKTAGEQAEFSRLIEVLDAAELRVKILDTVRRNPRAVQRAGAETRESGGRGRVRSTEFMQQRSPWHDMHEIHRMGGDDARDAALGALEERGTDLGLRSDQLDQVDNLVRRVLSEENPNCDGGYISKRTLITESPQYRNAFRELMTSSHPMLTAEEVESVRALRALESRAMTEGTGSAGGFGIPVFIDPSVILSAGAGAAPIMDVCRVEHVTTSQWKGVSSAGATWSWDAEGSAVSDDSPTLAQPVVPVYTGRGFLPVSLELAMDYPGFADEMSKLLTQGALDLLAASTATGTGTAQPTGIITKLEATAGSKVKVAAAGALTAADVFKVWNATPERFRSRPSTGWGMSVSVESQIRSFSSANQSSAYFTVNLNESGISYINGAKVTRTDYFPSFTAATTTQALCTVGDWSNYLVALRAGMNLERIDNLFDQATGRPSAQRGFFAWLRSGHDVINPPGFRILDQT
jgi:HK97 family phage major capsid protein